MDPLVSVIMPAYNAEAYIADAIRSVLAQRHANWELVIVNDGSTDRTREIIRSFPDPRIRVFDKPNGGIGSARNMALEQIRGELLCGLDADDVLPPLSLSSRVPLLVNDPGLDIVDGKVLFLDATLNKVLRIYQPALKGDPFPDLVAMRGRCFMGFSWLIRWPAGSTLRFTTRVTHGEDLCFYLGYAQGKRYDHVPEEVLWYRRSGNTVMSDLDGLARSYGFIHRWMEHDKVASAQQRRVFREHSRSVMTRSYLRALRPWRALQTEFDRGPFGNPYPL